MIYEYRRYNIAEGKREEWVRFMEEEIIPFQIKKGMVVIGSFIAEEDTTTYVWIRRFKDDEERKQLYEKVYQSDYWKSIAPRVAEILDRETIQVTRLIPTPKSVLQ